MIVLSASQKEAIQNPQNELTLWVPAATVYSVGQQIRASGLVIEVVEVATVPIHTTQHRRITVRKAGGV